MGYEPRSKVQINALIEFEQFIVALRKALVSLDIDLINQALIELFSKYHDEKLWRKLFEVIYSNHMQHLSTRSQLREHDVESPFGSVMDLVLIQSVVDVLATEDVANQQYKRLLDKFLSQKYEEFQQFIPQNQQILATRKLKESLQLL